MAEQTEIITIKAARKLLSKEDNALFSDEDVRDLINHLDMLATWAIRSNQSDRVTKDKNCA